MKIIPIKIPNKLASVPCRIDDADYKIQSSFRWLATINKGRFYVVRAIKKNKITKKFYLHREIMKPRKGKVVDHINENPLDNRRVNLRICSQRENIRNAKKYASNTSGFKGVYLNKQNLVRKWTAQIRKDEKHYTIGSYATPEEAALAYDREARKLFGRFANVNFK